MYIIDMNSTDIVRLRQLDCSKVKRFSFEGLKVYARVVDVHDTDTITIVFYWSDAPIKINVRLEELDSPELHSKIRLESEVCKQGRDRLKQIVQDQVVSVYLKKYDKYGRVLASVHTLQPIEGTQVCVNQYLIDYGYARSYDGGTKAKWTTEELLSAGRLKK